jgi:hypothetical protein
MLPSGLPEHCSADLPPEHKSTRLLKVCSFKVPQKFIESRRRQLRCAHISIIVPRGHINLIIYKHQSLHYWKQFGLKSNKTITLCYETRERREDFIAQVEGVGVL